MTLPDEASASGSPGTPANRTFKLTTEVLIQMLSDEEFYTRCVAWFWLRNQGLATAHPYKLAIARRGSELHVAADDSPKIFAPLIGSFIRHTVALWEADPEFLHPLRLYLAEKLHVEFDVVVIPYKEGSETHELISY